MPSALARRLLLMAQEEDHPMTLVPWIPRELMPDQFRSFRNELDKSFSPLLEQFSDLGAGLFLPSINIKDGEEHLTVTADLPGVDKQDVDVQVNGSLLTLRGHRKWTEEETDERKNGWWRRESSYGEFTRRLTLPCDVDPTKTDATMHDGVLTIRLAKAEKSKAKAIAIK
jgi:HSP20 family protein